LYPADEPCSVADTKTVRSLTRHKTNDGLPDIWKMKYRIPKPGTTISGSVWDAKVVVISTLMTYHWVCNKSNTTGTTCGAGTAYSSGAHALTSDVERDSCCSIFSFHGKMQLRLWWWLGEPSSFCQVITRKAWPIDIFCSFRLERSCWHYFFFAERVNSYLSFISSLVRSIVHLLLEINTASYVGFLCLY
jgi:hypothetical protein